MDRTALESQKGYSGAGDWLWLFQKTSFQLPYEHVHREVTFILFVSSFPRLPRLEGLGSA